MSLDTAKLGGPYETVFDVGAFRGDFAKACIAAWHECRVECFEPLETAPEDLPDGINWHRMALGNLQDRQVDMWCCEFVPSSSFLVMGEQHKTAFPYTRRNALVRVPMYALVNFAERIEAPALLKIDVQGYELEVLRGAGEALSRFAAVVFEVNHEPLYEGAPAPDELAEKLAAYGFRPEARIDELRHPKTNALLQSDELWVR